MRGLRIRLLLGALVAALAPLLLVGFFARKSVADRTRETYGRRLDVAVASVARRVSERTNADERAVARLCERDFVVDRLMLDLAADRFGPARQDELVALVPPLMHSLDLDVLDLIDERATTSGVVLASGHYPGRDGARDDALRDAARRARDATFVRTIRVRDGGQARDARALLSACLADRGDVKVRIVGGRFLDAAFLADLAPGTDDVQILLEDAGVAESSAAHAGGGRRLVHTFVGEDGAPVGTLVAVLDDSALSAQLAELDRGLAYAAALAVLLALLIGLGSGLWLSRPLAELEDATRRVGAGDLDATVTVRSGGEVGKALEAFNEMTRALRKAESKLRRAERIAAWRDIARRIAHEIKNPLSPIQVSIETMRKTYKKKHPDFDEIFEESTLTILEEVERLRRIVTEFSEFARMARPKSEPVDVREVASHVVALHRGGDVDVSIEIRGEQHVIRGDRDQLTQVLENLVKNAIEATSAAHGGRGGRVSVVVEEATHGVTVRIEDDGPGIPEPERLRIFEPYYTTKAGGTGLGLSIVHRIVLDHGGAVEIGDAELGGAELIIELPFEGPPPEASASMTDTAALPLVRRR